MRGQTLGAKLAPKILIFQDKCLLTLHCTLAFHIKVLMSTCPSCSGKPDRPYWLLVPHSLACNPVFGRGVKYHCVQRAGSTRQQCARFCSTVARHGLYERMLGAFDNDSIHRILRVRRRDCVLSVELRQRLCLTSISILPVQRRLHWFGHAARRPEGPFPSHTTSHVAQTS